MYKKVNNCWCKVFYSFGCSCWLPSLYIIVSLSALDCPLLYHISDKGLGLEQVITLYFIYITNV